MQPFQAVIIWQEDIVTLAGKWEVACMLYKKRNDDDDEFVLSFCYLYYVRYH